MASMLILGELPNQWSLGGLIIHGYAKISKVYFKLHTILTMTGSNQKV